MVKVKRGTRTVLVPLLKQTFGLDIYRTVGGAFKYFKGVYRSSIIAERISEVLNVGSGAYVYTYVRTCPSRFRNVRM